MTRHEPARADHTRAVREAFDILQELSRGAQAQFLLEPKGSLSGLTPIQALARGMFDEVRRSAEGFAER